MLFNDKLKNTALGEDIEIVLYDDPGAFTGKILEHGEDYIVLERAVKIEVAPLNPKEKPAEANYEQKLISTTIKYKDIKVFSIISKGVVKSSE